MIWSKMILSEKLRNRRLATPCTNYGTVYADMESGGVIHRFFPYIVDCKEPCLTKLIRKAYQRSKERPGLNCWPSFGNVQYQRYLSPADWGRRKNAQPVGIHRHLQGSENLAWLSSTRRTGRKRNQYNPRDRSTLERYFSQQTGTCICNDKSGVGV